MFATNYLIKLRDEIGSYPVITKIPDKIKQTVPKYLGIDYDSFVFREEVLLVIEKKQFVNCKEFPYAYKCLLGKKLVYIINMSSEGLDPNICFIKCS